MWGLSQVDVPERVVEEHHVHLGGKRNVAQPQSTGESAAGNLIHVTHHDDIGRREIALNQALDAPQPAGNGTSRLLLPRPDPLAGHTVACRKQPANIARDGLKQAGDGGKPRGRRLGNAGDLLLMAPGALRELVKPCRAAPPSATANHT